MRSIALAALSLCLVLALAWGGLNQYRAGVAVSAAERAQERVDALAGRVEGLTAQIAQQRFAALELDREIERLRIARADMQRIKEWIDANDNGRRADPIILDTLRRLREAAGSD